MIRFSRHHISNKHLFMQETAKKRGISFSLTKQQLAALLCDLPVNCPCCKYPFILKVGHSKYPSVDRIDHKKGYEWNNVWVICSKCNNDKNKVEHGLRTSKNKDKRVDDWISEVWTTSCIIDSYR